MEKDSQNQQNMEEDISIEAIQHVIEKYTRKKFEGLSLEDLAVAVIHPDFAKTFTRITGEDWNKKYQVKAFERLNFAKFDINWLTRKSSDQYKPLFTNVERNDIKKVKEFIRAAGTKDVNLRQAVNAQKKSPVHIAATKGLQQMTELLILEGFTANCRDKTLKTPLHCACACSHAEIVDFLLKTGNADIEAKDSQGKNCLHFAAGSAQNGVVVQVILDRKPQLALQTDNSGMTPLHYAVWNNGPSQIEIIRKLLENQADINARDNDGKTPLHHASAGGRVRAIAMLMPNGADFTVRDKVSKKTAMEVAANDRTRESIVVYSQQLEQIQKDKGDQAILKQGIVGQKARILVKEEEYLPAPTPKQINPLEEPRESPIAEWVRGKFYTMMKKLQEDGVTKAWYHLKKPYLYTGSWMEGIKNLEELFETIKDVNPPEAVMRSFNILCPYDKPLPIQDEQSKAQLIENFFGAAWYQGGSFDSSQRMGLEEKMRLKNEYEEKINALVSALDIRTGENEELDKQLKNLEMQNKSLQSQVDQAKKKYDKIVEDQKNLIKQKDDKLNTAIKLNLQLQEQMQQMELDIEEERAKLANISNEEVSALKDEIKNLKQQLAAKDAEAKAVAQKLAEKEKEQIQKEKEKKIQQENETKLLAQAGSQNKEKLNEDLAVYRMYRLMYEQRGKKMRESSGDAVSRELAAEVNPFRYWMKLADEDADGKLSQPEFSLFCEMIQMQREDTQALLRVARFVVSSEGAATTKKGQKVGKVSHIGIQEFQDLVEERTRIQTVWRGQLGRKIARALKEHNNISLENAFNLMNVDGSESISAEELRNGLESLKIVLTSQRDFNNLYEEIDEGKEGKISLQDIQKTLEKYRAAVAACQASEEELEMPFDYRFVDDEFDNSAPKSESPNDAFNGASTSYADHKVRFNEDVDPVPQGCLQLQIPYARDLIPGNPQPIKSVIIRVLMKGSATPDVQRSLIAFDNTQWKFSGIIPMRRHQLLENVNDVLHIQLYQEVQGGDTWHDFTEEHFLGEVKVLWKACVAQPMKWVIDNDFNLVNISYKKQKTKVVSGLISVQCRWVPAMLEKDQVNILYSSLLNNLQRRLFTYNKPVLQQLEENLLKVKDDPTALVQPGLQEFVTSIVEEGMLEVNIVSAFLQEPNPKLQIEVKLPKNASKKNVIELGDEQNIDTKFDAKKNPYWGKKLISEIKPVDNTAIKSIWIYLFTSEGMIIKDRTKIGEVFIDWEECLRWPGLYLTPKSFLFKAHQQQVKPNKVYVQVRWVPRSLYQEATGFSSVLSEKDKKKMLQQEDLESGVLKVLVLRAKNLRADDGDTSDPYCIIEFENHGGKKITCQTRHISKTLNPEWRETFKLDVFFFKDGPIPPLMVQLMDHDNLGDDSLGSTVIDLTQCREAPGDWSVNKYFDVDDKALAPDKPKPQVYILAYYVPKGMEDKNVKPKDIEGIFVSRDSSAAEGTLIVKVIHARQLRAADKDSSDPYAIVQFPNQKEHKTATISTTLNPIWKERFEERIVITKDKLMPIKVVVKDSDLMASDDLLGFCDITWESCLQNPGKWSINQVFELQGTPDIKGNLKTLGYIYLQVKFLEQGMVDDQQEAPNIENLAEMIAQNQGIYKGQLRIFLVHCQGLLAADDDTSDPLVKFKVPGGKILEVKEVKKTLNPVWKAIYSIQINMPLNTVQPMRVEIEDYDLTGNDFIGYMSVNIENALKNPRTWGVNEIFKLEGNQKLKEKYSKQIQDREKKNLPLFGEIYMQIMFVIEGDKCEDPPMPLIKDIEEEMRKDLEEAKMPMKGFIMINIIAARGVRKCDRNGSDPYCEVYFPDKQKITTQTQPETLNPIWNFQHKQPINILKEAYKKLNIIVNDEDGLAQDDQLGTVEIDWMDCFLNPTMWQVNDLFKLQGDAKYGKDLGDIYIQAKFLRDEDLLTAEGKANCKTKPENIPEFGKVLGTIDIKIISALNLKNADFGGKSDPFIIAYLSTDSTAKIKTLTIQNELNPVWNFTGQFNVNLLRCQVKTAHMVFDLQDEDNLSTSEQIGQVQIDLIDCLEKPDQYVEQDYTIVDPEKKDSKVNLGTVKLGYKWNPSVECESLEGLRAPEIMLQGEMFVKIVCCKDLKDKQLIGKSDPFLSFYLSNDSKKVYTTPPIDNDLNPPFNKEEHIQLSIGERKIQTLKLTCKVLDKNIAINTILGGVTIELQDRFKQPFSWMNEYLPLRDEKGETGQSGYIYFQIQWRPQVKEGEQQQDQQLPEVINYEEFKNRNKPPTFPGELYVKAVGARKLPPSKLDTPDPFCEIKVNKGEKKVITTPTKDDTVTPVWNHSDSFNINLSEQDWQDFKLIINVWDYNYCPRTNSKIGECEVKLDQLFSAPPGTWINEIQPLLTEKQFPGAGELLLQIQWRQNDKKDQIDTKEPENLFAIEEQKQKELEEEKKRKEEEEQKEPTFPGLLYIKIVQAANLICADMLEGKSDGYVEAKMSKGDKNIITTPVIDDNSNPEWNFDAKGFNLNLRERDQTGVNIQFTVYDHDVGGKDFLGYLEVNVDKLLKNKNGEWINEIFQLLDSKGSAGKNGLIYIQIQWRPADNPVDTSPPQKIDIKHFYKGEPPNGTLLIKAVKAVDILGFESNKSKGNYSDAFLKIIFGTNDKNKTKVDPSANPTWNQIFEIPIKYNDRSEFPLLTCELYDQNTFKDTFLGDFSINISDVLDTDKVNTWAINNREITLTNLKQRELKDKRQIQGAVTISAGFVPQGQDVKKLMALQ